MLPSLELSIASSMWMQELILFESTVEHSIYNFTMDRCEMLVLVHEETAS